MVPKTRQWLEKEEIQQELALQLLGMKWCGKSEDRKIKIAEKLRAMQMGQLRTQEKIINCRIKY
jgi:hypothetical protein